MKTFELKSSNKKAFSAILVSLGVGFFIVSILLLPWIISNSHGVATIIAVLVMIGIAASLRKILAKKYTIQISDTLLEIRKDGRVVASAPVETIVMLKLRSTANSNEFAIYTSASQSELIQFDAVGQLDVIRSIIAELQQYSEYVVNNPTTKMGNAWTEYVNKNAVKNNTKSYKAVQTAIKTKSKKTNLVIVAIVALILFLTIIPFFINPKAFYERKDDKLFYGKKELVGINIKEVEQLGYQVIKDSSHVYYKGEILEWADRDRKSVV